MDKDQLKKDISLNWRRYFTESAVLDAIVRDDSAKLDEIKACQVKCNKRDVALHASIDKMSDKEREVAAATNKHPEYANL